MRICVLGAGAIGGYFGGRLAEKGQDVTFLVRPARAEALAANGLQVKSRFGDIHLPKPKTVLADTVTAPFDLVILSCKAYDLADSIRSIRAAVGPETTILPLLNGMSHLGDLDAAFGPGRTIGGQCAIAATLDRDGTILHLNDVHAMSYGERDGSLSPRVSAIEASFAGAIFAPKASRQILLEMWEKWVFLSSLAAATSSMRGSVGDIVAVPGGRAFLLGLLQEGSAVAASAGFAPREATLERLRTNMTLPGSPMQASMARDLGNGAKIEADHIVGDLIRRGREAGIAVPRLEMAYTHLKTYEAKRAHDAA